MGFVKIKKSSTFSPSQRLLSVNDFQMQTYNNLSLKTNKIKKYVKIWFRLGV